MNHHSKPALLRPFAAKFAHTYSIVARDPTTGEMGVAVQSHWFSVGSLVTWAEAGVGAIATQSFINVSYGPEGLELLRAGQTASEAVQKLTEADEGREVRQLAIVDAQGNVAAHTGRGCVPEAGHHLGPSYSVQANLMLNDRVWPAMAEAFEAGQGPLAERLVTALAAGQAVGGDIRGKQSAAILVVKGRATGKVWEDRLIDLRVEDHTDPVNELKRVLTLYRAYEYMNEGDRRMEANDVDGALNAYRTAEAIYPANPEMPYWHAISLANAGRVDEALPMLKAVFARDDNWRLLTGRLPGAGLLKVSPADLARILTLAG
jgi:uncharacterized Ntn-hydrolase superfamily protein